VIARDVLPAAQARTLVALIRVYNRAGRATVRDVVHEDGRAISTVHLSLRLLRRRGLVRWTEGQHGTLTPLLWPVAA
jgi:hypothetical protein